MSEQTQQDFVTARELNMAVSFLSNKIDAGFRVTHEKQDHTNGRLLRAESAITYLKANAQAEKAVADAAIKRSSQRETWRVTLLSTFGTTAIGGVGWVVHKLIWG